MESRNLHFNFNLFHAVRKKEKIKLESKSALLKTFIGVVAFLLITVNLATPFLHTHQFETLSFKGLSISSAHCEACEFEATQAIDPGIAIVLHPSHFIYETKAYEVKSVFISSVHSSSESRGPPSIS